MLDWVLDRQAATLLVAIAHAGADRRAVHLHPEGLLPGAGHGRDPGHLGGAADDLLRRRWPSASRRSPRSCCRIPRWRASSSFIGVDGNNPTLEQRPHADQSEAARAARRERRARSSGACSRSCADVAGHHALHAAGAGPDHRGPGQPHAVPVHRGRRDTDELEHVGAEARRPPAPGAAARGRRERPAGRRPAGVRGDRPRHREPAGHHAGDDRQRAVQRVRPAPRFDHLHPDQPVPRRARGEARVPARAGGARQHLRHRRRVPGQPPQQVPLSTVARVVEKPAPLAINHIGQFPAATDLVQPRARRVAGRRGEGDRGGAARDRRCRRACRSTSRARRSRSARRSPTSCG